MKNIIVFIMAAAAFAGCGERDGDSTAVDGNPLKSVVLYSGTTRYYGNMDYGNQTVSVGVIQYGSQVTGAVFDLAEGASVTPDPQGFVGKWPESQKFTVTSDGMETVYTVQLTDYKGLNEDGSDGEGRLPMPGLKDGYKVVFSDDFENGDIPDEKSWGLAKPDGSPWSKYMSESHDQAYVEDGLLVLKAEKTADGYKAGGIWTQNKVSFRHATVDVSARFKTAQGAWPAIWLMPQNPEAPYDGGWPNGGEVDIMEQISNEKMVYQTVHSHYTYDLGIKDPVTVETAPYNDGRFNIYSVDMTSEEMTFYVNGQKTFSYPNLHLDDEAEKKQWPFSGEFFLILNCALGGEGTWPGTIEDSQLPAIMEVDWVRISIPDEE